MRAASVSSRDTLLLDSERRRGRRSLKPRGRPGEEEEEEEVKWRRGQVCFQDCTVAGRRDEGGNCKEKEDLKRETSRDRTWEDVLGIGGHARREGGLNWISPIYL